MFKSLALLLPLLLTACTAPHPLSGGKSFTAPTAAGALTQSLTQGDNPVQPSRQSQHTLRTRTFFLPAAAASPFASESGAACSPACRPPLPSDGRGARGEGSVEHPESSIKYPPPTLLVTERTESDASTELGAAQKDTARDLTAKLTSLKPLVWVGLLLFLSGLASIFWAPLRLIIGSLTTSAAITAGGLALMVLPTLLVGHELLLLAGVAIILAAWFLAHRHGHLRGQLSTRPGPRPSRPQQLTPGARPSRAQLLPRPARGL